MAVRDVDDDLTLLLQAELSTPATPTTQPVTMPIQRHQSTGAKAETSQAQNAVAHTEKVGQKMAAKPMALRGDGLEKMSLLALGSDIGAFKKFTANTLNSTPHRSTRSPNTEPATTVKNVNSAIEASSQPEVQVSGPVTEKVEKTVVKKETAAKKEVAASTAGKKTVVVPKAAGSTPKIDAFFAKFRANTGAAATANS